LLMYCYLWSGKLNSKPKMISHSLWNKGLTDPFYLSSRCGGWEGCGVSSSNAHSWITVSFDQELGTVSTMLNFCLLVCWVLVFHSCYSLQVCTKCNCYLWVHLYCSSWSVLRLEWVGRLQCALWSGHEVPHQVMWQPSANERRTWLCWGERGVHQLSDAFMSKYTFFIFFKFLFVIYLFIYLFYIWLLNCCLVHRPKCKIDWTLQWGKFWLLVNYWHVL
jgi:hypothetical protein